MIKSDIGGRVNAWALAAATVSYTPLNDRAGRIRRVLINNGSAADTWDLSVGGRVIMSFRVDTVGNQQPVIVPGTGLPFRPNFFDFCRDAMGLDPSVPVPLGMTATLASRGGATADVALEVTELDASDLSPGQMNHYRGQSFLIPLAFSKAGNVTAVGLNALDTQWAPAWVPQIIPQSAMPVNWKVELLAAFLEGQGRNTFSGAADHQSQTRQLVVVRNGEQLYTHTNNNGLLVQGVTAAAGSANSVFGQRSGFFSAMQESEDDVNSVLDVPIVLNGGDNLLLSLDVQGDVTGGADYTHAYQLFVARITAPAAS